MESWLVGTRNLEFYESFDEVDEKWRTTIRPQMFPPKPEEKEKFNLNRWYAYAVLNVKTLIKFFVACAFCRTNKTRGRFSSPS